MDQAAAKQYLKSGGIPTVYSQDIFRFFLAFLNNRPIAVPFLLVLFLFIRSNAVFAQDVAPGVSINSDGRLEVAIRNIDCSPSHVFQSEAAVESWVSDISWGGCVNNAPFLISNGDGRLEIFGWASGNVYHNYQVAPGGGWSGWINLSGLSSVSERPVVVQSSNGTLEIFALQNSVIYESRQTTQGDSNSWSGWYAISGPTFAATPTAITDPTGLVFLFAQGADGAAWVSSETSQGGSWSGWSSVGGGIIGSPTAALNADGLIQIFARDQIPVAGFIYMNSQRVDGTWSGWSQLGRTRIRKTPTAVVNADGRIELFGLGADSAAYHIWQGTAGNNGTWGSWAPLGGYLTSNLAAARNIDGRLEVFALGSDNVTLFRNCQTSAGGGWSGWYYIADGSGPAVADSGPNYPFGARGELLASAENDGLLNFGDKKNISQETSIQLLGHWPCGVVGVSFTGFDGNEFKAAQKGVANWNQQLSVKFDGQPPVKFVIGNVPYSPYTLTIHHRKISKDSDDLSELGKYTQGYPHVFAAPKNLNTREFTGHVDIDIEGANKKHHDYHEFSCPRNWAYLRFRALQQVRGPNGYVC